MSWINKLAFISVSSLLASGPVYASNWVIVSRDDSLTVYVDTQSVRKDGVSVKVWSKWVWSSPQKLEFIQPAEIYKSVRQLSEYHCNERTYTVQKDVLYADTEMTEVVDTLDYPDIPEEVVPGSSDESIFEFVCKAIPAQK
ncbi:MAG: hypothetical protein LBE24_03555 [Methylobacillus sp.]|jgi:hypothetical protein|nr:hypothetical protein [Methylobacillus sp.]